MGVLTIEGSCSLESVGGNLPRPMPPPRAAPRYIECLPDMYIPVRIVALYDGVVGLRRCPVSRRSRPSLVFFPPRLEIDINLLGYKWTCRFFTSA